jgi:hypothetical protein
MNGRSMNSGLQLHFIHELHLNKIIFLFLLLFHSFMVIVYLLLYRNLGHKEIILLNFIFLNNYNLKNYNFLIYFSLNHHIIHLNLYFYLPKSNSN